MYYACSMHECSYAYMQLWLVECNFFQMNYIILNFELKLACVNINELVSNCIDFIYGLGKIKKDRVLEEP